MADSAACSRLSAEVGYLCPDRNCHRSVAHSRPGAKVALDAATRLRGHILDPSVGQVGNLWRSFIRFNSLSMDQSPLCGEEHRPVGGKHLLQQGDLAPRRYQQDNQHRCQLKAAGTCYRCGYCNLLAAVCAQRFKSMGHVPPLSLRRILWSCGSSLWYRPWLLCIPSPLL